MAPDKKRKQWSRQETHGFLKCYLARKREFSQPKKRRTAFANVLEDMVSMGITDSERTPVCLESKMRNLLQAYKAARDNNKSTGASPCFAPYMELMDEIFGHSPIISNNHTIHLGRKTFANSENILPPLSLSPSPSSSTTQLPSPSPSSSTIQLPSSSPSSSTTQLPSPSPSSSKTQLPSPSPSSSTTQLPSPSPSSSTIRRKRSARELYYDKKLELKKKEMETKTKRKEEHYEDLKKMLSEKWEKEAKMQELKNELLKKIIERN